MFEHKTEPLVSPWTFYGRLARSLSVALAIVAFSLGMGTAGYHYLGGQSWIDALLNAAMILTGMGPVNPVPTTAGKLFATFYALYSGIAFLTMMAVVASPVVHRFMHRFHMETEEDD